MFRALHLIPANTKIDFVGKRWWAFGLTIALLTMTVLSLSINGLNLGIDFKGGILIEAKSAEKVQAETLRKKLNALNLGEVTLQEYGAEDEILLRVQRQEGGKDAQENAIKAIRTELGDSYEYRRVEVVGPTIGEELFRDGILATVLATLAIAAYVAFRFEWQFGVAALVALLHDVIITIGLFALLDLDFNLTSIAALLTLAGYSINDTVVVFDRIREMMRRQKTSDLSEIINLSINQTLSRTIITAGTTLLALLPLVLLGGQVLLSFSLALFWGIVIGTYSSIFIAAALLIYFPPLRKLGPHAFSA